MTKQVILNALKSIKDPTKQKDIVSLGYVQNMKVGDGSVGFDLQLDAATSRETADQLKAACEEAVKALSGMTRADVRVTSGASRQPRPAPKAKVLEGVRWSIAVASGKGGVGKSTVTANLALALANSGARVGLLDCDIYGPSIPLMFGLTGKRPGVTDDQQVVPLEAHGIRVMSMGFLSNDQTPIIWRGPMVHQMVQQFLTRIAWGELDYLLIDLPPGTGDTQLTLTQSAPLSGAVIVTTPQEVSLIDARKGLEMFQKVKVPVLGAIENMSHFSCPDCGHATEIFKRQGPKTLSEDLGVPLLGAIPIDPAIAKSGDEGVPIVRARPDSTSSLVYREIARVVTENLKLASSADGAKPIDIQWQPKHA
jgi:ATP-binding protein involved in chromosome partitioning